MLTRRETSDTLAAAGEMQMGLPELFGSYVLHDRLADGTMSEVFLAQTIGPFPRLCAVKRIRPQLAALKDFRKRFEADAQELVQLIHGNLAQVLEVGMVDEQPFLCLELIEGVEHAQLVATTETHGPLPVEAVLHIVIEMCEAIAYLQRRAFEGRAEAHWSIPSDHAWSLELMTSFDGVVKVVDLGSFGALRIGQQPVSSVFRSPGYASPEVIKKARLSERSQVFSVGLVLWELLVGKTLVARDPEAYVGKVLGGTFRAPLIERLDVPANLIRLLSRMLSLDPIKRPERLEQVREELVAALRRIAPSYGSSQLADLLLQRCQRTRHAVRKRAKAASRRAKTDEKTVAPGRTLTFGVAAEVDRKIGEPIKLEVGARIPNTRYRLVRSLGEGGSAEVFCAQHVDLDRKVAIKVLDRKLAAQSHSITQFRMEARACSRLGHPNIVDVNDFGELPDGRFFYAMELVEGESLADLMSRKRKVPIHRALAIIRQTTRALQAAHDHYIIHRDIKPENIMLTRNEGREDFVKILDFGVMAFATDTTSESVGTPGYMAPEQVEGELPTAQMDIYSLGITLYEMIAGALPYPGETLQEFANQQAAGPPLALRSLPGCDDVHPAIERVVHRALERDPDARPPSCADFEADLLVAQKAAGITTAWDDLPPPAIETLLDQRRTPPQTGPIEALEEESETLPAKEQRTVLWIGAVAAILIVVSGWVVLRDDSPQPTPTTVSQANPKPAIAPAAPRPRVPLKHLAWIVAAEKAAAQGDFTRPKGRNAYDALLTFEGVQPNHPRARRLREQCALTLQSMASRLWDVGYKGSARTLYREALLFRPDSPELRRRAASSAVAAAGSALLSKPEAPLRPAESAAEIAHLVAQIQLAVANGKLIAPPKKSALALLSRLKRLDPTGKLTKRVQGEMARTLRQQASLLWSKGHIGSARDLYRGLAQLDPEDLLARTRSIPPKLNAEKGRAKTAPLPKPTALDQNTAAGAKLVAEGRRLLAAGKIQQARSHFVRAREADPRSAPATAYLAKIHLDTGQYIRAAELAQYALRLDRRFARAHIILGDAFFQLGRRKDALGAYRAALEVAPNHKGAKRRLQRLEPKQADSNP